MDLQQMRIDAMEEGEEKYQAQRRLDFQKELFSIKEHGEALIKAQQEIEKNNGRKGIKARRIMKREFSSLQLHP